MKRKAGEIAMNKFLMSVVGVAALSAAAPASAADLAARPYAKAPVMVAAAYDWSGFYLGVNGGGAWSRKCWDVNPFTVNLFIIPPFTVSGPEGCNTASGATAGGQVGYRWQSAAFVFGLEAQGNWADLRGSNPSLVPFFAGTSNRSRIDGIGLFTGQVGYSWNTFLLYVKGGAAVTGDRYAGFTTATGVVFDRASETRWGGTVGVGGEYAFTPNWSAAIEYDHLFMGTRDVTFNSVATGAVTRTDRIRQDVDMVTARINYRWGGPVVAKY
jgi:outer membrane immunogenic protein